MTIDEAREAGRKQAEHEISLYARGYLRKFVERAPAPLRLVLRGGVDKLCDAIRDGEYRRERWET